MLLHFVQLGGVDGGNWVFLSVNRFLLQSCVQLWERQWCGVGTQSFDPIHVDGVGDDAQLQAFNVGQLVDGALAIGHVAKAKFVVTQAYDAFFQQFVVHFFTKCTVNHRVSFFFVGKHEGEVKHRKVFDLAGQNARVQRNHFQ